MTTASDIEKAAAQYRAADKAGKRKLVEEALSTWLDAVNGASIDVDAFAADVAGLWQEDLGVRDALLYSLIDDTLDVDDLVAMAAHERTQNDYDILNDVYLEGRGPEDAERLLNGTKTLVDMRLALPDGHRAHTSAIMGWIAWWTGKPKDAMGLALAAHEDDPGCTLANLVARLALTIPPSWIVFDTLDEAFADAGDDDEDDDEDDEDKNDDK